MIPPALLERFAQLLDNARSPRYRITAHEQLAAASELTETLMAMDELTLLQYAEMHSQISVIRQALNDAEIVRVQLLISSMHPMSQVPQ